MNSLQRASATILSASALSLAAMSGATALELDDSCVPPGLFEPTGLVEPMSVPETEIPDTDADLGRTV